MSVEFGLSLPTGPPKNQIARFLGDLEEILPWLEGHFKSLWMTDHFFWDDEPTFEAWTVLAYIAARWPNFKVGPMVLGQSYRNPALLAKMGATLQALSRGNFIMAVGAGWKEDEYHAYGYPYPRAGIRIEQLEETLEILIRMWTEPGPVSYQGKHYSVADAWCEPKPDPVPPILVGGGGRKTMMLAARYADLWNIPDANFADYGERVAILHEHCRAIGRDPASIRLSWFGRLVLGRTTEQARQRGGQWTPENAIVGTPAQVNEHLQQFIDRGADYFMVEVLDIDQEEVRGMLLDEVLAKFR